MPAIFYLAAIACLATLAILVVGIVGFGSGKASPRFSNKIMRYRIAMQFIAVLLILAVVALARSGG